MMFLMFLIAFILGFAAGAAAIGTLAYLGEVQRIGGDTGDR